MKVSAVIAAGGEGKRMGRGKQFIELCGTPMVIATCKVFDRSDRVNEIVLVVPPSDIRKARELSEKAGLKKITEIVAGGRSRQASVESGLAHVSEDSDIILIHDGARPLVTVELIGNLVDELKFCDAVIAGVPVIDTIKRVSGEQMISETLERGDLWSAQTPQGFKAALIREAHLRAIKIGYEATDDSKLVERTGHKVKVIMGSYENFKITSPCDLAAAEGILSKRVQKGDIR